MTGQIAQIMGVPTPATTEPLHGFLSWTGGFDTNYNVLLGPLLSRILLYAIIFAGLIFFAKLLMAGYGYLTSAGDSAKIQSATKNLTNAAIGLFLVFTTFFIAQLIQIILGIHILS